MTKGKDYTDIRMKCLELAFQGGLQYGAFQQANLPELGRDEKTGIMEHNWAWHCPSILGTADALFEYVLGVTDFCESVTECNQVEGAQEGSCILSGSCKKTGDPHDSDA